MRDYGREMIGNLVLTKSADGPWVDSRAYTSINEAITDIGSENKTLLVSESGTLTNTGSANTTIWIQKGVVVTIGATGTYEQSFCIEDGGQVLVDYDCTINGNIECKGDKAGVIAFDAVTGDETLTINGSIDAGLYHIFGVDLGISGRPKIEAVYPEWGGATASHGIDLALEKLKDLGVPFRITSEYEFSNNTIIELTNNIVLLGNNTQDSKFILNENTTDSIFTRTNNDSVSFYAEGISFVNNSDSIYCVINPKNDAYFEKVEFFKCYFSGPIRCFDHGYAPGDIDPTVTPYGVSKFYFTHCKMEDLKATFCKIDHCILEDAVIKNNKVRNFDYPVFYSSARSIIVPTNFEKLRSMRKKIEIEDNDVMCDDDYQPLTDATGSYYVFCLIEARDVYYRNNKVQGMKDDSERVVYDIYIYAQNATYEGNIWRNNISLSTDDTLFRYIIKSKGGAYTDYPTRTYRNNIWEFTNEWMERNGFTIDDCKTQFYDIVGGCHFVFENNYIKIPNFGGLVSSEEVSSFQINNNTISVEKVYYGSSFFIFNTGGETEWPCSLSNNRVEIKGGLNMLGLFHFVNPTKINNLSILGNRYLNNSETGSVGIGFTNSIPGGRANIEGNLVEGNLSYGYYHPPNASIFSKNNVFKNSNNNTTMRHFVHGLMEDSFVENTLYGFLEPGVLRHWPWRNTDYILDEQEVYIDFEISSYKGWNRIVYKYNIVYDDIEGKYKITFTDTNDTERILFIGDGTSYPLIKVIVEGGGTHEITVAFSEKDKYFWWEGIPSSTYVEAVIRVKSMSVT